MAFLKSLAATLGLIARDAQGPEGARLYVVGDVHGRADLLDALLERIFADMAAASPAHNQIVFLGDLIDRGPDSAGVMDRVVELAAGEIETLAIAGNHEEFLMRALAAEPGAVERWLDFGGRECAASYGIAAHRLATLGPDTAAKLLRAHIPMRHVEFVHAMHDSVVFGDYLCVHAGIRPGIPLDQQQPGDLRWIREPFLSDRHDHGAVIVHGHTISRDVVMRNNRIGIDTGAYATGVLTALVLEGEQRRLLQVTAAPGDAGVGGGAKRPTRS